MTFQKESGKEGLKILLMLASVIIITAGLQAGKPVLLPIVLSGFLAIVSYPLTTFFKSRLCFPHWLAVTFTVIMDFGILVGLGYLMLQGEILTSIVNHINAYVKHTRDVKSTGGGLSLEYPSVAQSIIEVQDLGFAEIFPYFHPWMEAAALGLLGFAVVALRRPGALFLLPLAALGVLSVKMGGRMVMFGAPIMAIGFTLPLYWLLQRLLRADLRGAVAGILTSGLLLALLVAPFADMIPAMSQGPIINRRHAEALSRAKAMTPPDAKLWLWWDWG